MELDPAASGILSNSFLSSISFVHPLEQIRVQHLPRPMMMILQLTLYMSGSSAIAVAPGAARRTHTAPSSRSRRRRCLIDRCVVLCPDRRRGQGSRARGRSIAKQGDRRRRNATYVPILPPRTVGRSGHGQPASQIIDPCDVRSQHHHCSWLPDDR